MLPEGSLCSTSNNRIYKLSNRFIDDCDDKTFCSGSANGTCIPKRCRTDLFPFGNKDGDLLLALCDPGSYCPDEGAGRKPSRIDWNLNGSLCLGSACSCVRFF
ncbi:hypothetical protein BJ322DRAFT_1090761 [Thelephora terrestris]|uniref:Uncharacterized protein n=1 Tax=Thelephora terrestris TaxID=56493 RepID=A0A9P6H408_9AGAM|nr:hypothetical protein BJ322DRAFT_1090761 [Thelephora terrestris]